ncbi:hypothetical protein Nmel_008797 [Mimus melanotis]
MQKTKIICFPKSFIGSPALLYVVCHLPEVFALDAHSL